MNHPINSKALTYLQGTIFSIPGVSHPTFPAHQNPIPADPPDVGLVSSNKLEPIDADILREALQTNSPKGQDILAANLHAESQGREVTLEEWAEWQDKNQWPEGHNGDISGGRRVTVYNGPRSYGVKLIGRNGKASRYFVNTFTNPKATPTSPKGKT